MAKKKSQFNPWLITWEIANPNNTVPENLIAAVLPGNAPGGVVGRLMHVLNCNLGGYLSDQTRYARGYSERIRQDRPHPVYSLGGSPFLIARKVWNYVVTTESNTGHETATWEDRRVIFDKNGSPTRVWKVIRKTYNKAQNVITSEEPVEMPIPAKKPRRK
jgi:hypothetical protein